MLFNQLRNNLIGQIQVAMNSVITTVTVDTVLGNKLYAMSVPFYLTIWAAGSTPDADPGMEIVQVTAAISNTQYTIVRNAQGGGSFSHAQYDSIACLLTYGNIQEMQPTGDTLTAGAFYYLGSDLKPHLNPTVSDVTKFLNGGTTPTYAHVTDANLSISDITTNNVTAAQHGFAPKLPNDATKFFNGTGAYTVPVGSVPAWANGYATFDTSTAPTTQTIAHGLGRIPKLVRISMVYNAGGASTGTAFSNGSYNGTTNKCVFSTPAYYNGSSFVNSAGNSDNIIFFLYSSINVSSFSYANATVDATNITLTWSITGTQNQVISFEWEAV